MTDKVQKIRAKIESLLNETNYEPYTDENLGRILSLKELKSYIDSIPKEHVSEDLNDAANNYCLNVRKGYPRVMDGTDKYIYNAFKAGAKWKEEKLMKDAIDAEVTYGKSLAIPSLGYKLDKEGLDYGDKVKVIIIKED